jgi:transcriptional regulator with XRE-family HTH domain
MEWQQIRDHYARLLEESGKTQEQVAKALNKNQNLISKLLANKKRGPTVETFVDAVLGLDVPLSEFFARLERHLGLRSSSGVEALVVPPLAASDVRPDDPLHRLLRGVHAAFRAFDLEVSGGRQDLARSRRRRGRKTSRAKTGR